MARDNNPLFYDSPVYGPEFDPMDDHVWDYRDWHYRTLSGPKTWRGPKAWRRLYRWLRRFGDVERQETKRFVRAYQAWGWEQYQIRIQEQTQQSPAESVATDIGVLLNGNLRQKRTWWREYLKFVRNLNDNSLGSLASYLVVTALRDHICNLFADQCGVMIGHWRFLDSRAEPPSLTVWRPLTLTTRQLRNLGMEVRHVVFGPILTFDLAIHLGGLAAHMAQSRDEDADFAAVQAVVKVLTEFPPLSVASALKTASTKGEQLEDEDTLWSAAWAGENLKRFERLRKALAAQGLYQEVLNDLLPAAIVESIAKWDGESPQRLLTLTSNELSQSPHPQKEISFADFEGRFGEFEERERMTGEILRAAASEAWANFERDYRASDAIEMVQVLKAQLSPRRRQVFELRFELGLTLEEVATRLGITKGAVGKMVSDIRNQSVALRKSA